MSHASLSCSMVQKIRHEHKPSIFTVLAASTVFMSSIKFVVVFMKQKTRAWRGIPFPVLKGTAANPFHNSYKRLNHLVMLQDGINLEFTCIH